MSIKYASDIAKEIKERGSIKLPDDGVTGEEFEKFLIDQKVNGEKMSRKFKIIKDYYSLGYPLYKKGTITINSGVTVLVGCNGIGKSTLMNIMMQSLKKDNIPCIMFDNLHEGGKESLARHFYDGNMEATAALALSSEGECIYENMADFAYKIGTWIHNGERNDLAGRFAETIFGKEHKKETSLINERWIFFDAVDSGLSIDNIVELKENLFKFILEEQKGKNDIYIIVSANEYEMANGENCFDVYNGKYIQFKDYDEYRNMILKSKEWKTKRIENIRNSNDSSTSTSKVGKKKKRGGSILWRN